MTLEERVNALTDEEKEKLYYRVGKMVESGKMKKDPDKKPTKNDLKMFVHILDTLYINIFE